jgi:hypothetical protein
MAANATLTSKTNIDPYEQPAEYLKAKGWHCIGNPNWQSARWLHPTRSEKETQYKEKIFAYNQKGEYRQVTVDDGTGNKIDAERIVIIPRLEPMTLQDALIIQMDEDMTASLKKVGTIRESQT